MKLLVLTSATILSLALVSCIVPTPTGNGSTVLSEATYPTARLHPTKKNYVVMPWRPHNAVDVTNFKPGQLARDPYTAVVNPKTGKRDRNTGKIFRIPARPVTPAPAAQN